MKLTISRPIITKEKNNSVRVTYELSEDNGVKKELWYSFPFTYNDFLTTEVADAVIVGILMYAMKEKKDIYSENYISSDLLFGITKYLMPFLCHINKDLSLIKINMPISNQRFTGKHVGTGISCGVDSLSTVIYHGEDEYIEDHKIDTLTLLNTGYYGANDDNTDKYKTYICQSSDFCKNHDYLFFTLDSNISNITGYNFLSAHTYLTCSVILLFQKYFNRYYYSSGYPIYDFKADFSDPAYYDTFLLNCISTQSLKFISSCATMSRVEKTEMICNHPDILKSLYVCTGGDASINCCNCEKCARTMLAIESLGKMDKITFRYNKDVYKKNRNKYFSYMIRHRHCNVYYRELYNSFREHHIKIPISSWFNIFPCSFEMHQMADSMRKSTLGKIMVNITKRIIGK